MPAPTPGYVKNMIRRSLQEIVDPSPTKGDVQRIWTFFDSECAYCGKRLDKNGREGHIDHLFPSALNGMNHISNRVLSCAACNEAEKLDGAWQEFMVQKNPDPDILRTRMAKIHQWQKLNGKPAVDEEVLRRIRALGDFVCANYDFKVQEARNLRKP